MSALFQYRWIDLPLIFAPGVLCIWGAYATSNSNQEDVRSTFPAMFLFAFVLYAAGYLLMRILAPRGNARVVLVLWLAPLAMTTLLAGGFSMALGYYIFAFVCAPIWGALLSLLAMPPKRYSESPAVSA